MEKVQSRKHPADEGKQKRLAKGKNFLITNFCVYLFFLIKIFLGATSPI